MVQNTKVTWKLPGLRLCVSWDGTSCGHGENPPTPAPRHCHPDGQTDGRQKKPLCHFVLLHCLLVMNHSLLPPVATHLGNVPYMHKTEKWGCTKTECLKKHSPIEIILYWIWRQRLVETANTKSFDRPVLQIVLEGLLTLVVMHLQGWNWEVCTNGKHWEMWKQRSRSRNEPVVIKNLESKWEREKKMLPEIKEVGEWLVKRSCTSFVYALKCDAIANNTGMESASSMRNMLRDQAKSSSDLDTSLGVKFICEMKYCEIRNGTPVKKCDKSCQFQHAHVHFSAEWMECPETFLKWDCSVFIGSIKPTLTKAHCHWVATTRHIQTFYQTFSLFRKVIQLQHWRIRDLTRIWIVLRCEI